MGNTVDSLQTHWYNGYLPERSPSCPCHVDMASVFSTVTPYFLPWAHLSCLPPLSLPLWWCLGCHQWRDPGFSKADSDLHGMIFSFNLSLSLLWLQRDSAAEQTVLALLDNCLGRIYPGQSVSPQIISCHWRTV